MRHDRDEERLIQTLDDYGYTPAGRIRANGVMRLRFLGQGPNHGRIEYLRRAQFESRVRTGRLQRVNRPITRMPHAGEGADVLSMIGHFNEEPPEVQAEAHRLYAEYQQKIQERRDVHAHWEDGRQPQNRAKTYAMVACLKTFQFDRNHMSAFMVQHRGKPPLYRYINEDTIRKIDQMINSIFFRDDRRPKEGEDSQMPYRWEMTQWETLGFEFMEAVGSQPGDNPPVHRGIRRQAGACFRFINVGSGDYSRLGIFNSFDPENYKVSCLITALDLNQNLSRLLQSLIQVLHFPTGKLKFVANIIKKTIWLHYINPKTGESGLIKYGDFRAARPCNIFIYHGHYMKYEQGIERIVTSLKLRAMSTKEENIVAKSLVTDIWDVNVGYPDEAVSKDKPFNDSRTFTDAAHFFGDALEGEDVKFEWFRNLMIGQFGVDPVDYSTIASFSAALFEKEMEGVYWLRGFLWKQIKKCEPKIIIGRRSYPFMIGDDDMIALDRNGSYTSSYVSFPGIPVGRPTSQRPENPAHYYLKIHVRSWRCRHPSDPYPLLTKPGVMWVDKTIFELISDHYDWDYEVEGGWYWKRVENGIREKAERLWGLKLEVPELSKILKMLLNALYGKSLQGDSTGSLSTPFLREISTNWGQPQFGVNVKSWSRKVMQEIVYKAADLGVEIFYSNTDSLFVRRCDAATLVECGVLEVGYCLGQFKIEREFERFICLSPKMYWMRLKDGSEKHSFGRDGEYWWMSEFDQEEMRREEEFRRLEE
jgi:hypothetical protein